MSNQFLRVLSSLAICPGDSIMVTFDPYAQDVTVVCELLARAQEDLGLIGTPVIMAIAPGCDRVYISAVRAFYVENESKMLN